MARTGRMEHNPAARDHIGTWTAWAENVGYGGSVESVHTALMDSPGHRKNLLSSTFSQVGVGVVEGGGQTWVTQVFRKPGAGQRCDAPAPAAGLPDGVDRIQGSTRHATAAALSKSSYNSAGTIIVASAESFPDALSASPLSTKLGAPVLLSDSRGLDESTRTEIRRLGATQAIVLGSLSSGVDKDLAALGLKVSRVEGTDRFDTAAKIATRVGGRTVVIAKGTQDGWVDAIAAAGYAAHRQLPVLLVDGTSLSAATLGALDELGATHAEIVGGPSAVSTALESALNKRGVKTNRIAGADRLETSAKVADASLAAGLSAAHVWMSTSRNWADALSAGPVVARDGGVLLLADPRSVSTKQATGKWLAKQGNDVKDVILVGGTAALGDRIGQDISKILQN